MRYQEGTPSRSDAKRNRKRILEVAVAELLECPDVPLRAIARKACVGQGTFYRNFPNRETLVLEIYRHEMGQLATSAAQLLEQLPPQEAIRRWMDELAEFVITRAGWRMRSA